MLFYPRSGWEGATIPKPLWKEHVTTLEGGPEERVVRTNPKGRQADEDIKKKDMSPNILSTHTSWTLGKIYLWPPNNKSITAGHNRCARNEHSVIARSSVIFITTLDITLMNVAT